MHDIVMSYAALKRRHTRSDHRDVVLVQVSRSLDKVTTDRAVKEALLTDDLSSTAGNLPAGDQDHVGVRTSLRIEV